MASNTRWPVLVMLEKVSVYLVMVGCQLVFGGYSVVSKVALTSDVDPVIFAFYRDLIASPILLAGAWYTERLPFPAPEDRFDIFLLGLLGIYGNQLFFILGVDYTNPINASLMQPSIPVFTTILAIALGIEVLRIRTLHGVLKIIGILGAVGGAIVVIVLSVDSSESSNLVIGNLCLVANCLCTAVFILLQKRVLAKYPPVTTTAYSYALGCICLFMTVIGGQGNPDRWVIPTSELWPLAYASILSSVICYSLITWANKRTSPSVVTAFYPLQVVAAVVMSAIVFGSTLSLAEILGGLLVIGGLFCVVASKMTEEQWLKQHPEASNSITSNSGTDFKVSINDGDGESLLGDEQQNLLATASVRKYD